MTHEVLVLLLSAAQVDHLVGYCVAYRAHAWREIAPTAERNQTLRAIQAVQGRLAAWLAERRTEPLRLAVSEEERQALRQMVGVLMQVSSAQASMDIRAHAFSGLASWLQMLRTVRQTQAL